MVKLSIYYQNKRIWKNNQFRVLAKKFHKKIIGTQLISFFYMFEYVSWNKDIFINDKFIFEPVVNEEDLGKTLLQT